MCTPNMFAPPSAEDTPGYLVGTGVGNPALGVAAGRVIRDKASSSSPSSIDALSPPELPPPPESEKDKSKKVRAVTKAAQRKALLARGRQATILTSGGGALEPATIRRKTLLGE